MVNFMYKYLTAFVLGTIIAIVPTANAETIKKGLFGCVSEDLLDEATRYSSKSDMNGLRQLVMSGQCTVLRVGEQVSVINGGFMTATIRYKGTKLFTPSESVR